MSSAYNSVKIGMMMQCLPNLVVAGVQKSGTTWLHDRLSLHPDIYMSTPKELNFFSSRPSAEIFGELDSYSQHFQLGAGKRYRGESSVGYFWSGGKERKTFRNENIPLSMKEYLGPDLKTIVILRNPVERALSAYLHHIRAGRFESLAGIQEDGKQFGILDIGRYKKHIETWLQVFPRESVLFFSFDDILKDASAALCRVHEWLGVEKQVYSDSEVPKNIGLGWSRIGDELVVPSRALNKLSKHSAIDSGLALFPRVTRDEICSLQEFYADDIEFVNRELFSCDHWKAIDLNEFPAEPTIEAVQSLRREVAKLKLVLEEVEVENRELGELLAERESERDDYAKDLELLRTSESKLRMELELLNRSRFTKLGIALREMRVRYSTVGGDKS